MTMWALAWRLFTSAKFPTQGRGNGPPHCHGRGLQVLLNVGRDIYIFTTEMHLLLILKGRLMEPKIQFSEEHLHCLSCANNFFPMGLSHR